MSDLEVKVMDSGKKYVEVLEAKLDSGQGSSYRATGAK